MEITTKKIRIDQLEVGMYVEDVYNSRDILLLSANNIVWDAAQIESLKNQGVQSLSINVEKGKDLDVAQETLGAIVSDPVKRENDYYKELDKAKIVHKQTLETAREVLDAIKKGTSFSMEKVEDAAEDVVESIMRNPDTLISLSQIKGYDEYTYMHSVGVSVLVSSLAYSMGYKGDKLIEAGIGGLLHDIGKMRVPESILNKPGKFTDWEFKVMKKHPEYGMDIIKDRKKISDTSKAVIIQHHERINGHGYPFGLQGNQIEEIGLISAVADVYDALTANRVYRPAWTPQKALALIFQGADVEYSRRIVELFTRHLGIYPVGSFVRLDSGAMGVVTQVDRGNLLAPKMVILFNDNGERLEKPHEIDLAIKQKEADGKKYHIQISLNPNAYRVNVATYLTQQTLD